MRSSTRLFAFSPSTYLRVRMKRRARNCKRNCKRNCQRNCKRNCKRTGRLWWAPHRRGQGAGVCVSGAGGEGVGRRVSLSARGRGIREVEVDELEVIKAIVSEHSLYLVHGLWVVTSGGPG